MCVRCFEDDDITHVEGKIDPLADIETIETELMLADLDSLEKRVDNLEKKAKGGDKEAKEQLDLRQPRAGAAARRQAGAACSSASRRRSAPSRMLGLLTVEAGALCLQCRGRLGRGRQQLLASGVRARPRKRARSRW